MDNQEYGPPPSNYPQGNPSHGYGGFTPPTGHGAPQPPGMQPPGMPPPMYPPVMLTGNDGASSEKNWLGISSLVLGLIGGWLLGLIFGILGVSAANRGRANNKTLAMWGVAVNIGVPVLLVGTLVVVGAISGALSGDRIEFNDLAIGDCVEEPSGWNEDGEALNSDYLTRVACTEPHWGQVYEIEALTGSAYPGDDGIVLPAEEACYSDTGAARIGDAFINDAYLYYVTPTSDGWYAGDRSVICFASNATNDATESWLPGY